MKINDLIGMRRWIYDRDDTVCYGIVKHVALTYRDKIAHVDVYWLTGVFKGTVKSHIHDDLVVVCEY